MCLAIPGKIIGFKGADGKQGVVKYPSETRDVLLGGTNVKVGDYVLVQMGIVLKTVTKKEALTSWKAWRSQSA